MTRIHFERLARACVAFRRACKADGEELSSAQYDMLCDQVALACSASSDTFRYAKFRAACELTD